MVNTRETRSAFQTFYFPLLPRFKSLISRTKPLSSIIDRKAAYATHLYTVDIFDNVLDEMVKMILEFRKYSGFLVATEILYPPKLCATSTSSVSDWLAFVYHDETYLNCTLAIAASYTDSFAGHAQVSPRALGYLCKAYALINKKLSSPEATTSPVIASVTSLVVYHRIHDSQAAGLIHFDGLERIIRLRGGMTKSGNCTKAVEARY
ncbi:hypothetical protein F5X68DRAFT_237252 [Plectosphaerella plurivora]|uniref:Uncharacterized protein n=1 Tax=Plectosphaerella plurivora TaxID=936078 RepID=A0A9P8V1K1_9PEZI|nr:hypothetical protein F5X68DRAFT_237252 [Plectosphaerella plurivora]